MSRPPKYSRRPRVVAAEDCPRCGAVASTPCSNYKGVVCAPHAVIDVPPPKPPLTPAANKSGTKRPVVYYTQGNLFPQHFE